MSSDISEERLESALIFCAYLMEQKGVALVPIFERLEQELADLRRKNAALDRARRLLVKARAEGKVDF
ncbi:hypothetical protein [Microvirga flavescens]|uniref:hypothetical protein n=1 Tax=Microvirga flavescens TaxID=2249811 RepID=UPI000DD50531|nr:hypothetical protein [Microvirga flavescens]